MKTDTIERFEKLEISAGIETRSFDFRIKTSAKAFRSLIDATYSDKIGAICREICSNAVDAHNMNKIGDRPFRIKVPTINDPEFVVRDFGPGISEEDIGEVFTVLFESTKEDTNLGVGKYGLGCKSPFAYTDTFSVSSYQNGVVHHWIATLLGSGIPNMTLFMTGETDEEDGLEVKIPVKLTDCSNFASVLVSKLIPFDVKPEVSGIRLEGIDRYWDTSTKSVVEAGDYLFYPVSNNVPNGHRYAKGLWAKMGCVIYPIDKSQVSSLLKLNASELFFVTGINGLIEYPVGSLEAVPSREHLSYGRDDPTLESISNSFTAIFGVIEKKIQAKYDQAKDFLGLCAIYSKLSQTDSMYASAFKMKNTSIGIAPVKQIIVPIVADTTAIMYIKAGPNNIIVKRERNRKISYYSNRNDKISIDVAAYDEIALVLKDTGSSIDSRIRHLLESKPARTLILLLPHDEKPKHITEDRILSQIECLQLSDLEKPKAAKVARAPRPPFKTYDINSKELTEPVYYAVRNAKGVYLDCNLEVDNIFMSRVIRETKLPIAIVSPIDRSKAAKYLKPVDFGELIEIAVKTCHDQMIMAFKNYSLQQVSCVMPDVEPMVTKLYDEGYDGFTEGMMDLIRNTHLGDIVWRSKTKLDGNRSNDYPLTYVNKLIDLSVSYKGKKDYTKQVTDEFLAFYKANIGRFLSYHMDVRLRYLDKFPTLKHELGILSKRIMEIDI